MESANLQGGLDGPAPSTQPTQRVGRILVLDDERTIGELLGEILGALGHRITLSSCPVQALELVHAEDFDAIISDVRMPGMNGRQFYEALKQKRPALAPKVAFLTGDRTGDETHQFLQATGNPLLSKPFQLSEIEQVVTDMLG